MNLWETFEKKNCQLPNAGFSLHFEKGIDSALRKDYLSLAKWLRHNYIFPEHIHIYITNQEKVRLLNGELAYGSFRFFANRPPRIKIPSKIETHLLEEYSLKDIYEQILSSFIHELTHYFQYVAGLKQTHATEERQANYYRYRILEKYYRDISQNKN